ncbi:MULTISPECIES: fimbria/pilus outer membrane usher protein [unclassified Acinetobacter]|uniref:fimbria/pilus outer membrane usher protein n=1 Tax=unclassified Acinetobacter TaxID=196816 RepID=UPI0029351D52|nr:MULTISPECIES: fimbria/pilus outer membrane usher protein [unclassified Acinetobacter]WOE31664.1 fimbria/pilus outer membrane usher protein [Acinetobacter sp. SAAs470]WOE37129.1 fimbria/pilus outer membrane usher protein [Acinetobacter sp. SAAs474]
MKKRNLFLIFINIMGTNSYAVDYTFNEKMLGFSENQKINIANFSHQDYIYPGQYNMSLYINNQFYKDINFNIIDEDGKSKPCLGKNIIDVIPFIRKTEEHITFNAAGCFEFSSVSGSEYKIDLSTQNLNLIIPKYLLQYTEDNWDPPKMWSDGINGFILDYNANLNFNNQIADTKNYTSYINGIAGFNFNQWRLRAEWQANYQKNNSHTTHDSRFNNIYVYRALKNIQANLLIGETYFNSNLFNSFNYTGITLESNEDMLPPSLRYYSPQVTGIANSNALVTISQQGRILYQTQVPAGNFTIQDLPNSANGLLDVKVEEQDGRVQNYQVDAIASPYLTRPGRIRYKATVGQPRDEHHLINQTFASGEISYGLNNKTSIYSGLLSSQDFHNINLGFGQDLSDFGAFSFSFLNSFILNSNENKNGTGYQFNYYKNIENISSRLQFSTTFYERNYSDFYNYINNDQNIKQTTNISFNKTFINNRASILLSYYNNETHLNENQERFEVNINKYFDLEGYKNINANLSIYKSTSQNDYGAYLRFSIPIKTNASVSYNANYRKNNNFSSSLNVFNRVNEATNFSAGIGQDDNVLTASSFIYHQGNRLDSNLSASYKDGEYLSLGINIKGGLTATAEGVDLHRINLPGGTRVLVDTDQISDIPVKGYGIPAYSNMFGIAVTPDVRDYYRNNIAIDLNRLPENADVVKSVKTISLTQGAIGYQKFLVNAGEKMMVTIKLANGNYPEFGTEIRNQKGFITGIVGEQGKTYLSGILPNAEMTMLNSTQCKIHIAEKITLDASHNQLICQ